MPQIRRKSLWTSLSASAISLDRFLAAPEAIVRLQDLSQGSSLVAGFDDLHGR